MTPFVVLCVVLYAAALVVIRVGACAERIDQHVAIFGPDLPPLPPPDADDAAFEAWALQALGLGNSAAFDTTRRQIADLPETGTA